MTKRSFCMLATTSEIGRSHAAGVLYELADDHLYVSTMRGSRKARNVEATAHVGVFLPVRRLPIGPPSSIQFQTTADVLAVDDPEIRRHVDAGHLRSITSHGELELPDGCFLRIAVPDRVHTYGLGMSLRRLISDPLNAAGVVDLAPGPGR